MSVVWIFDHLEPDTSEGRWAIRLTYLCVVIARLDRAIQ
jgi:hypothetical protein